MQTLRTESRIHRAGAALLFGAFLASLAGLMWARAQGWPTPALWLLVAVAAAAVAAHFYSALMLITAQDEFLRGLAAKSMILASGVAITLATIWSLGETLGLPRIPAWLLYPVFWGVFGVVSLLVKRTTE